MNAMTLVAGSGVFAMLEENIFYDRQRTHLALNHQWLNGCLLSPKRWGGNGISEKKSETSWD
jgi:hypothetical protein